MPAPLQLKPEVMVFFGLRKQPFDLPEKLADIYPSLCIQNLQNGIEEALLTQNKLVFLTGKTGVGSSTMASYLIGSSSHKLVYFPVKGNPSLNSTEILLAICRDYEDQELLTVAARQGRSISKFASNHLFTLMKRDTQPVIVIDQAHAVSARLVNDTIRFCEAVNSRERGLVKLLLVFSGPIEKIIPQLRGEWVNQRQYLEYKMESFKRGEAKNYLLHRMKAAGLSVKLPFTEQTIMVLAEKSQGSPVKLDRLVIESLNNRVPTLMRRSAEAAAQMSEEEKTQELKTIRQERLRRIIPALIVIGIVACAALGVFLSL